MRHQELYDHLKNKNPKDLSEFDKDLLRDWGNSDIFGPWTEESISAIDSSGKFKFFKAYFLVDIGNEQTKIDTINENL